MGVQISKDVLQKSKVMSTFELKTQHHDDDEEQMIFCSHVFKEFKSSEDWTTGGPKNFV